MKKLSLNSPAKKRLKSQFFTLRAYRLKKLLKLTGLFQESKAISLIFFNSKLNQPLYYMKKNNRQGSTFQIIIAFNFAVLGVT
jgi:hypothetical protein